jgi:hypothetical protein
MGNHTHPSRKAVAVADAVAVNDQVNVSDGATPPLT